MLEQQLIPGQPVAIIQIVMQQDGQIKATYKGPDRNVFNMMMARAEQDMVRVLIEQEGKMKVEAAPAGIDLSQLGISH